MLGPLQHERLNKDWRLCVRSDEGDVAGLEPVGEVRTIRGRCSLPVGPGDVAGNDKFVLDVEVDRISIPLIRGYSYKTQRMLVRDAPFQAASQQPR